MTNPTESTSAPAAEPASRPHRRGKRGGYQPDPPPPDPPTAAHNVPVAPPATTQPATDITERVVIHDHSSIIVIPETPVVVEEPTYRWGHRHDDYVPEPRHTRDDYETPGGSTSWDAPQTRAEEPAETGGGSTDWGSSSGSDSGGGYDSESSSSSDSGGGDSDY